MAFNPDAVFISPSSLADFEKCPQLYYYRNIYRSPRGLKIQLINPSLALGQTVHDTLDQFLKLTPLERTHDSLISTLNFIWSQTSGEKGGFTSNQEESDFKERAMAMLEKFWSHPHFKTAQPVKLPNFPKLDLGDNLILTGKLDWIEEFDGGFRVIDFKTGKNEEKEDSLQLPIYALLAQEIVKTPNVKTFYWYLDKDDDITSFDLPDLEKTKDQLKQKGELVKLVRQTQSYRCQSGQESCWACRDFVSLAKGAGKLVTIDPVNRRQEIYILTKPKPAKSTESFDSLPF